MIITAKLPEGTPNEKAKMVLIAFETVIAVAMTLQTDTREDVRAVAVLLYAGKPTILSPLHRR
jgi:hypothetical protein